MAPMAPRLSPRARRETPSASQAAKRPAAVPRRRLDPARPSSSIPAAKLPARQPQPAGDRVGHDGPVRQAHFVQVGGRRCGQGGQRDVVVSLGQPGAGDGRLGQVLPTVAYLALEQGRRLLGRRPRRCRVPVEQRNVSQQHEALGQILLVPTLSQLFDGIIGHSPAVLEQPGSYQGTSPAEGAHSRVDADLSAAPVSLLE